MFVFVWKSRGAIQGIILRVEVTKWGGRCVLGFYGVISVAARNRRLFAIETYVCWSRARLMVRKKSDGGRTGKRTEKEVFHFEFNARPTYCRIEFTSESRPATISPLCLGPSSSYLYFYREASSHEFLFLFYFFFTLLCPSFIFAGISIWRFWQTSLKYIIFAERIWEMEFLLSGMSIKKSVENRRIRKAGR